ncbi:MAG: hypothetical protein KF696_00205 [Planctomycetes bacterium]|nr:hypothetical protein [Planctomycetota bacterium]MCW8134640.1 hypothetical protein [Planctomycetota bacterium]
MRLLRHDYRDFRLAFALAFDLRRVMYAGYALCWTLAVPLLVIGIMSWRAHRRPFSPEGLYRVHESLTSLALTPANALALLSIATAWWIGFGWLCAPVLRSAALDIARDERERPLSIPHLNRQAAFAPLMGMAGLALGLLIALGWALLAAIPAGVGTALGLVLVPIVLVVGAGAAAIGIVALSSAPMMGPTAVVEGRDYFEALSRPMSYVMQQPGRYLGYLLTKLLTVAISALLGGAVLAISWGLVALALWITGQGEVVTAALEQAGGGPPAPALLPVMLAGIGWGTVGLLVAWLMVVSLNCDLLTYLLMRYRVDGVTFDQIAIAEDKLKRYPTAAETAAQAEEARRRHDEQQARTEPEPAKASQ